MMVLKIFIVLAIAGLTLSACKSDKHYSFNDCELEWILYNNDPPKYLVNKTDTVTASVTCGVMENDNCYHESMPNHYDEYYEEGTLEFYLRDTAYITSAMVRIYSYKGFKAEIDIPGGYYDYVRPRENTDTTLVNGVLYYGVHKYNVERPEEDAASYFCFVPGKGYVQIILNNGTLIELISE